MSIVHVERARRRGPQGDDRGLRAADLPGAHAARRRPQPPVPVHLRPRPVGGGDRVATRRRASAASPGSRCPTSFPRLVPLDDERFLPAEELVIAHLDSLVRGMIIEEAATFRVTRNADLTLEEEEADDLLEAVEMELRRRRFNRAVRLEVDDAISDEMLDLLVRELDLHPNDVYRLRGTIDFSFLWQLHALDRPDLKDRPWPPITAGRIASGLEAERPIFSVMRDRAILVHHPYESFTTPHRGVHRAGRRRPAGAVDQDDAVPRRRRQPDHPSADPRRRARRAGGRARRAQGPLRRGDQRQLGQATGARRRPRRVRHGRAEDALEVRARRARRRRPAAPLLPHRHRQLQHQDGPPLRGPRHPHVRQRHRRRRRPAVQPPHRLQPRRPVPHAAGGADATCDRGCSS